MESNIFLPSATDTIEAGLQLAAEAQAGSVIALVGELGAGKTHFSKGFAAGLGIAQDEVSSPTFTLLNEYTGPALDLFHFDFYRLDDVSELDGLGWDEILDAGGVVLAEWANLFPEVFPENTTWVTLVHAENGRQLSIRRPD